MIALGILIATVASFAFSAVLYALPPVAKLLARTSTPRPGIPMAMQMVSVVLRSVLASGLIAGLMLAAPWHGPVAGALLGLALSVLPAVLLMGGIVHENTAVSIAGVHLLDWVAKLVIIGAIIGLFV